MQYKIKNLIWKIKTFILQPIIPLKDDQFVEERDYSYINSTSKYDFYWVDGIKYGHLVKVLKTEYDDFIDFN